LNFKNIILEEKLSNKFKNSHEIFFPRKASLVNLWTSWFKDIKAWSPKTMETHTPEKFSWPFLTNFFFQNDIFKLQEDFSELRTSVILDNGIGSFQTFLIL
jgi:hypothetical protein